MKVDITPEKIEGFFKARTKLFSVIGFILFVFAMGAGTYFVLYPSNDKSVARDAAKKEQELNINFDRKALQKLEEKTTPAVIPESSGRNPFMPY